MKKRTIVSIVISVSLGLLSGCATVKKAPANDMLTAIKVPENQVLTLKLHAVGVQIYECHPTKADASQFEWEFKAPRADLFDYAGRKVGRHYEGPTWEYADSSKVVGELKVKQPARNSKDIPWLLLSARSTSGSGVLGLTKSIQRLYTQGGNVPEPRCTASEQGKEVSIGYKATYYFYQERSNQVPGV
ncbi:MAG: DUF3455 domain-containing protein [Pseudomonadota bacterium]